MEWIQDDGLRDWLSDQLDTARNVVLISPFITSGGLDIIRDRLQPRLKKGRKWTSLTIVTCLDPMSVVMKSLDIEELIKIHSLSEDGRRTVTVHDCPNLHAKVFLMDDVSAVVGSGNLTQSGTSGGNREVGVKTTNKADILDLRNRIAPLIGSRQVSVPELAHFKSIVEANFAHVTKALEKVGCSGWGKLEVIPGEKDGYFKALRSILLTFRQPEFPAAGVVCPLIRDT